MGDFNDILSIDDFRGARRTSIQNCDEFAGMVCKCDLTQLEHTGLYFTCQRGSLELRLGHFFYSEQ